MRYKYLGGLLLIGWIGAWPLAAHADYLSSAQTALQKGDLRSAEIELRNAVRSDPQNAEAHFLLGTVSLELGNPVAAEREARAAEARGFALKRAIPLLARSLLAQHRFDTVLHDLTPNTNNPELNAIILVFRGYAEIGLRHFDDAQKAFEQAASAAPGSVDPLLAEARFAEMRGDLKAAEDSIERAVALQPQAPEVMLAKSQLLRIQHKGPAALKVLDALVREQPSLLQARLQRAGLEIALNKFDAAKSDLAMVQKAMPGNVEAIYLDAVMAAQNKDFKAADADLERISPFISRIPRAYYLVAVVKDQLGELAVARQAAARYLARAPEDVAANTLMARLDFAQGHPENAIATLAKFVKSGKANAEIYDILGQAYASTGRGTKAVSAYEKAEALAPNNVGIQTHLATARLTLGQPAEATQELEKTLQQAPKSPVVSETLFFAALATGDMHTAANALAKIRAAQGDTPIYENLQGLYKLANLDVAGARQEFADIVKKHPDFLQARINLARVTAMEGRQQDSEQILAKILAKHPAAQPALTMLATDYARSKDLAKATTLFENAHKSEPNNVQLTAALGELYIHLGAAQKAVDLAKSQTAVHATTPEVMAMKAAAFIALGQKSQAIATDSDLLKSDPTLVGVRHQLVSLLVDTGNFQQARNVVQAGLAATPHVYQLYQDYVMIDLKAKGLKAALASADQLESQNQAFAPIAALNGDVYNAANRPDDAVTAYEKALATDPSAFLALRLSNAQLRLGHKDAAIKTLSDWTAKHPEDLGLVQQLSEIQIEADQYDAAEDTLRALLAKRPHDPVALNNLAWLYQRKHESGQALGLARQAYILSPTPQTADTLGWILTTSGQAKVGVDILRQASAQSGGNPSIMYHYAVALRDTGSKADAIKVLNAVVASKQDFTEKTEAQKLLTELTKGT